VFGLIKNIVKSRASGGAALEAAVILPILLFVAVALIFHPLSAFYTKIVLTDAIRQGVRHVAIFNNEVEARTLINQVISTEGLDPARIQAVTFDYTVSGGRYITARITYSFPVTAPAIPTVLRVTPPPAPMPSTLTLQSEATFRREWGP
jgi:hypothetical protein